MLRPLYVLHADPVRPRGEQENNQSRDVVFRMQL